MKGMYVIQSKRHSRIARKEDPIAIFVVPIRLARLASESRSRAGASFNEGTMFPRERKKSGSRATFYHVPLSLDSAFNRSM